jgi:O-antigen ligase
MADTRLLLRKAYIYATYGLAASIPFTENISTIAIAIWVFLGLFHLKLPHKVFSDRTTRQQLILPVYFLLTVTALIYTRDVNEGLAHLERKVSLLIIPLMILFTSAVLKPYLKRVLEVFVISTVAASVICVIMAFYHSISIGEDGIMFNAAVVMKDKSFLESNNYGGNYFFHEHLSLFKHSSYFAIYICFSLFLIIRYLLTGILSRWRTILTVSVIIYLLAFLFLLSSRISFIYIGIAFILGMVFYFRRLGAWIKVTMVLFLLVFVLAMIKLNYRVINVSRQDFTNTPVEELSQRSNSLKRFVVWRLVSQYEENIRIFGTGPGDVHDELDNYYKQANVAEELEGMNAHNQFLESYLGLGIIGLIMILALFWPLFHRKVGFLSDHSQLLLLALIFFMVESAMERNAFIVFFSFFQPITFFLQTLRMPKNKK